ncbi:MAG TPA: GFA family protein [Alphaproteobacteria bacterium]|jgi:hypothetical protein
MPVTLEGSCRCGAVTFSLASHAPQPYQLCYCSICRKTAGGGFAINIMGDAASLKVVRRRSLRIYRAELVDDGGHCTVSSGERHFCARCASALWMADPEWPELVHPFASAIDSPLPVPPARVHLMLRFKASWVTPQIGEGDETFEEFPTRSIEQWHRGHGLWIA